MSEGDTTFWVDVSQHDWNRRGGNLDWAAVLRATSPVMCARATYGDPTGWNRVSYRFADFQAGARAAGFNCRGGYHNLIRGDAASMMRQADWLSRELDSQSCDWAMADVERYAELVTAGLWPRWEDVLRFRDAWYATSRPTMSWYLAQWVYNSTGFAGGDLRELPGPLIQAHYLNGYGSPQQIYDAGGGNAGTGWDDCYGNRCPDAWQFTALATVDGASDRTDVNAFRGTLDMLQRALTTRGGDMPNELEWAAGWIMQRLSEDADMIEIPPNPALGYQGYNAPNKLKARLVALEAKLDKLATGGVDVTGLAAALAPLLPKPLTAAEVAAAVLPTMHADMRDAIADFGESGAAGVRANQ